MIWRGFDQYGGKTYWGGRRHEWDPDYEEGMLHFAGKYGPNDQGWLCRARALLEQPADKS